uniref:Uncharacterized protein n=1 Tax=biofilter metagenome TaxID=1070537 RepID=A0A1A7GCN3_9ZZZZ
MTHKLEQNKNFLSEKLMAFCRHNMWGGNDLATLIVVRPTQLATSFGIAILRETRFYDAQMYINTKLFNMCPIALCLVKLYISDRWIWHIAYLRLENPYDTNSEKGCFKDYPELPRKRRIQNGRHDARDGLCRGKRFLRHTRTSWLHPRHRGKIWDARRSARTSSFSKAG